MKAPAAVLSILLAALPTVSACRPSPERQGEGNPVRTLHLDLRCSGSGNPVVVIDVGLGDRIERWGTLPEKISALTRVCVYARAGYSGSDAGPFPRTSDRVDAELDSALAGADVQGPFLLVGHSIGALNAQIFAARYPKETAGLVLLDPPPLSWITGTGYPGLRALADSMTAAWEAEADRLSTVGTVAARQQATFLRTVASEHRQMFGASGRAAAAIKSFGNLPLIVIASGRPNPGFGEVADEYQRFWDEQSRALSEKSSRGKYVLIENSSHMLYADAPERVLEAVRQALQEARHDER